MNPAAGFLLLFAAIAPFTERGQTDFDTFLDLLNPWGGWVEAAPNDWRYVPFNEKDGVPFTRGQWIYTDFGWTWSGKFSGSWATDHYGWWVRDGAGWSWHPSPLWHAAPVDFRQTKEMIGWRPSQLGLVNELVEKDEDRFAHPEEWFWVPKAKFAQPLDTADVVTGAASKALLEDSEPLTHLFTVWREIERPGPDPEKVLPASQLIPEDQRQQGRSPVRPRVLLSLPTFWTPLPDKVRPDDLYIYRPEVFQDASGVERRVQKWYHPGNAAAEQEQVNKTLRDGPVK